MASKFKSLKVLIRIKHVYRPPACNFSLQIWPRVVKLQAKGKKRRKKEERKKRKRKEKNIHPRNETVSFPFPPTKFYSLLHEESEKVGGDRVTFFLYYPSGCGSLWWLVTIGSPC